MTNKQTIDGVSRELLEELQWHYKPYDDFYHKESGHYCPVCCNEKAQGHDAKCELRALLDAPTDTRAETVPKHKFDTLVQHCKRLDGEIAQARAHVNEITLYQQNAVWFWQHDGQDFLESLSCPIIIQPHQLRELLKGVIPAAQPQGEVERLQLIEQAGQHVEDHLSKQLDIAEITIQGLRAKLAERDALLREWVILPLAVASPEVDNLRQRTLSTSSEPKP